MKARPPTARRQRRGPPGSKTKEEIVESFRQETIEDAAIAVIARKGLAEMTIQDVAAAAGISKGTVYLYYRDREELVAKTAARAFETLIEDLDATFSSSGTLDERLMRVVLHPIEFAEEHAELLRAATALAEERKGSARDASARLETEYHARLEAMFVDACRRGEMREVDCSAVAAVVLECVRGMLVRRLKQPSPRPRESEAELIVSLLLRGIQTRPA